MLTDWEAEDGCLCWKCKAIAMAWSDPVDKWSWRVTYTATLCEIVVFSVSLNSCNSVGLSTAFAGVGSVGSISMALRREIAGTYCH